MKTKAEIYKIKVCSGEAIDMVHGAYYEIVECYIPSEKISFNCEQNTLNCFISSDDRYSQQPIAYPYYPAKKIKDVEIDEEDIKLFREYIDLQNKLLERTAKLLSNIQKI